ncbi:UNVERIFIED_CONTAM: hypothetical protein GTU68_018639 [Idotea baltica]|nr:hypothetical protein [Idotea baltica]
MVDRNFAQLRDQIRQIEVVRDVGRVASVSGGVVGVTGLGRQAQIGDRVAIQRRDNRALWGEVIRLEKAYVSVLTEGVTDRLSLGDRVIRQGPIRLYPHRSWLGRVISSSGLPLDDQTLLQGDQAVPIDRPAPPASARRPLGTRLETGLAAFNTFLPLVCGQRLGLFSGSGVGKSTLLGQFARGVSADIIVVALIGERGREVGSFVKETLGADGLARSIIVAATSDQSAPERRRCALSAMAVAEFFRDQGHNVLFLADSLTRFAEAHREMSVARGEPAALRGHPASMSHAVMSLCERAGPGVGDQGDITAIFTVLVAGSDMDEPVADVVRGVLDGHVILERTIAERGRFPAVDLLRSVSRSLPNAATEKENALIAEARHLLGVYDRAEMMIQAGLYTSESDKMIDRAIQVQPALDQFLAEIETGSTADSFAQLERCLSSET